MTICKVTFDIDISKRLWHPRAKNSYESRRIKSSYSRRGTVTIDDFPFVPFDGLHLGDWQMVNVCQVHYLGTEDGRPVFHVNCESIQDPDYRISLDDAEEFWATIESMQEEIVKRTKMNWIFTKCEEDKVNAPNEPDEAELAAIKRAEERSAKFAADAEASYQKICCPPLPVRKNSVVITEPAVISEKSKSWWSSLFGG